MNVSRPRIQEILVLQHSHLDVGYSHSQPILWELQIEYIGQALDWLESTADLPEGHRPKWTCEVIEPVLRWLRGASTTDAARFRRLFRDGRIGLGALRWHTAGLADRAGLRRLLDGKTELEDFLGGPIQVACQHDVNGVSWEMADVLLDAGVDLLVMAVNRHLGNALDTRPGMFRWEAPSGRHLRVFNGHHYTMFDQNFNTWDDSVDRMAEGWSQLDAYLDRRGYGLDFVYLTSVAAPILYDNSPPNPFMPDLIGRWNAAGLGPRVRYATFDDLRVRALAVPDDRLPAIRGDWTDYWVDGYGSTPIATAVNQRSKPILAAAELLSAEVAHPTIQRARDTIDLFDEHTWGYYITNPEHPQAQTGEALKVALAHEGHELASFALMDGLERLAENPVADRGIKGVLVVNPSPHPVSVRPRVPAGWLTGETGIGERTYRASRMMFNGRSWEPGAESGGEHYEPLELDPFSWRSVGLEDLAIAAGPNRVTHELETTSLTRWELNTNAGTAQVRTTGKIESPFHTLHYDPATGRVLSLFDRIQGRELLDQGSEFDLFAFVRERTNPLVEPSRYAFYERDLEREKYDESCWNTWNPIREQARRVTSTEVHCHPGGVTLERRLDAPGMLSLVQRISLHGDHPVISLEVDMELAPDESPQGIYFALPLAMDAGWNASYDIAGRVVELDADQLPGACRNWVAAESSAVVWGSDGCVALLTPDAPLVQFGDFNFRSPLDEIPRDENPLLLAWPANNYWDTNFPRRQTGPITLRYGFVSLPERDQKTITRLADGFRAAPLQWPITAGGRDAGVGTLRVAATNGTSS